MYFAYPGATMSSCSTLRRPRGPMTPITLSYIFTLATQLEPLERLPDIPVMRSTVLLDIYVARNAVHMLYESSVYTGHLRSSYGDAQTLLAALDIYVQVTGPDRELAHFELFPIKDAYRRFKIALNAEMGVLNSFCVGAQKGGLDAHSLTKTGEKLFPIDLIAKVPEALFDVREAAKCLAYETPTAAGYHVFRATESVLRRYYAHMTHGAAPPKVRSIKVYTKALRSCGVGTEKVLTSLEQMAELHRNPLIHPEVILSQEEAYGTFGIARSVIGFMLSELPRLDATTSNSVISSDQNLGELFAALSSQTPAQNG
jgi:hypothetical protein